MHRSLFLLLLTLAGLAGAGCFRRETRDVHLEVPGLASSRDVVLITNAAQRELMGEMPAFRHECRIDLARTRVDYHEGARLADPSYQRRMLDALAEAGYPATIRSVRHDPPQPLRIGGKEYLFYEWPDRYRAELVIPSMHHARDANRVADALACARLGGRPANLVVDPVRRTVRILGQQRRLATPLNYAQSIAAAGYDTDLLDAFPEAEAPPRGWIPSGG